MNADEGSEREETNSSQTQVVVISISEFTLCHSKLHCINGTGMTLVMCALACGAAVLALLVVRRYCHQKRAGKSHHTFCVESFQSHWGQVPMQGMWCMMRLFFLQPPPPPPLLSFQLNQMQPMPLLPEWPVIITPHNVWYCLHIHGSYLLNHQLVF